MLDEGLQFDQAEEALRQAAEAFEGLPGVEWDVAANYLNLGVLLRRSRRTDEATDALGRALDILRAVPGSGADAALCLYNLGAIEIDVRDFPAALTLFGEARDLYGREGKLREAARCRVRIGVCFLRLDELGRARTEFEAARDRFVGDPEALATSPTSR